LVFKESEEQLPPVEQAIQDMLWARAQRTLKSIREQKKQGTKFRGLLSDKKLTEVGGQLKDERGMLVGMARPLAKLVALLKPVALLGF
jgi:hypothetical protein